MRTLYGSGMRPAGVRQRVRELQDREWDEVHSWSDQALRVHVTSFVNLCARQWHHDHPMTTVLRRYREVIALLDDPQQLRTGSDFETRSLASVEQLRPLIGDLAERDAADVPFEPTGTCARPAAVDPTNDDPRRSESWLAVPPAVLERGELSRRGSSDALPRRAAHRNRGIPRTRRSIRPRPTDDRTRRTLRGLPSLRETTATEVGSVLSDFLAHAPWLIITD